MFEPGEMVRVIDGPFNDFNGVVEDVNYEKSRLNVAVLIFGGRHRSNWNLVRSKRPDVGGSLVRRGEVNGDY